jgi:hypothetical protein
VLAARGTGPQVAVAEWVMHDDPLDFGIRVNAVPRTGEQKVRSNVIGVTTREDCNTLQ